MSEKRNFWIRLNEHFFNDPRIEYLLGMRGGDMAVIVYQKLLLRGMNTGGHVFFFNDKPCNERFIASALGITTKKLQKCVEMLRDMELLECMEDGSYFVPEVVNMVGGDAGSAARMRRLRAREKAQADGECDVTCDGGSDAYIDKDKEKEINKEIDSDTDSDTHSEKESAPAGPSYGELLAICKAKKYHRVDLKEFMEHYRAMNWSKGGKPITDWNAQLMVWDYSKRIKRKEDNTMGGFG